MRKEIFICDTAGCGAVLVNPEDGFVIIGEIRNTGVGGDAKVLVSNSTPAPNGLAETSLCCACICKALGLHPV